MTIRLLDSNGRVLTIINVSAGGDGVADVTLDDATRQLLAPAKPAAPRSAKIPPITTR